MLILGIETSCDETSAALLEVERGCFKLRSQVLSSSIKDQLQYGGIIPEVAARKQMHFIVPVIEQVFHAASSKFKIQSSKQAQSSKSKNLKRLEPRALDLELVTAIAVTIGPGLATSLQVGIDAAKTLSYSWQKPLIPVNHLEGHLFSPLLTKEGLGEVSFPAVALIVSGGHTELILVKDYLKYSLLGRTRDDAAGEAFDKVARMLGLAYPGGPKISKYAAKGDPEAYNFPRGMINSGDFNFSFSGLKTAVLYKLKGMNSKNLKLKIKNSKLLSNLCASFQQAVIDVLVVKTMTAIEQHKAKTLLVGGGVAANPLLRRSLEEESRKLSITYNPAPITYTGDNAAMIALAGYYRYKANDYLQPDPQLEAWQKVVASPNLKLI